MLTFTASSIPAVLLACASIANAHSWVEQLNVIGSNGKFTGAPGYARGNILRGPGFNDDKMVHLLPPDGRTQTTIQPSDPMCMPQQQTQTQTNGSPRLKAAPGAFIALRYQENGHVTLPQNQPGKPNNRGTVYIYGTTQPKADEKFLDVHKKWNAQGTGGDKRGVLLSTQPFDDGQCYQVNGGQISTQRQAQFPHQADQLMGTNLWCQNDIAIPKTAPSGKPYTLYWIWDWPTAPNVDPGLPKGKEEVYTTCMDVDITAGGSSKRDVAATGLNVAAIPAYMKQLSSGAQPYVAPPAQAPASGSSASQPAAPAPASPAPMAAQPAPAAPAPQPASPAPAVPAPSGSGANGAVPGYISKLSLGTEPTAAASAPATSSSPVTPNSQSAGPAPGLAPASPYSFSSVSISATLLTGNPAPASSAAPGAPAAPGAGVLNSAVPGYMSPLSSGGQSTAAAPAPAGSQSVAPSASQATPAQAPPQPATQATRAPGSSQGLTFQTIPLAALKQAMPSQAPKAALVERVFVTKTTNLHPTERHNGFTHAHHNHGYSSASWRVSRHPHPLMSTTAPTPKTTPIPQSHSERMPTQGSAVHSSASVAATACYQASKNLEVCPGGNPHWKRSEATEAPEAGATAAPEAEATGGVKMGSAKFRFT